MCDLLQLSVAFTTDLMHSEVIDDQASNFLYVFQLQLTVNIFPTLSQTFHLLSLPAIANFNYEMNHF